MLLQLHTKHIAFRNLNTAVRYKERRIYVAVNFLFQLIFVFPLFLGMVMYANEFETKEKQKLTEIKNKLQHIHKEVRDVEKKMFELRHNTDCCIIQSNLS